MFVYSHTHSTKLQMAEGKIMKEVWGAALRDRLASLYAPPMLVTAQGKHEEESNNEFRGYKVLPERRRKSRLSIAASTTSYVSKGQSWAVLEKCC